MGLFDKVLISCPKCHKPVEFQSKAGKCTLEEYKEDEVPIAIAADIEGESETCPNCGTEVVATKILPMKRVAMHGAFVEDYEWDTEDD